MDAWIGNEALYSKSAGKRKVGEKLNLAEDAAKAVMVYKLPAEVLPHVAPVGPSPPRCNSSRSRSASDVPSPTPIVGSSPATRPTFSVVVPVKVPKKSPEPESVPEVIAPAESEPKVVAPAELAPDQMDATLDAAEDVCAGAGNATKVDEKPSLSKKLFFDPPTPSTLLEDDELDDPDAAGPAIEEGWEDVAMAGS